MNSTFVGLVVRSSHGFETYDAIPCPWILKEYREVEMLVALVERLAVLINRGITALRGKEYKENVLYHIYHVPIAWLSSLSSSSAPIIHLVDRLQLQWSTLQSSLQYEPCIYSKYSNLPPPCSRVSGVIRAGMLWSGEAADVKELESNMEAYCNLLNGFLLLCHSSTVDAGPTLRGCIKAAAKQVVDCSFSLLKEAVSSCDSQDSKKKQTIPQLSGTVWEACSALKKTPSTNYMAIGRAITQVGVSMKDILREMKELKPMDDPSVGVSESRDEGSSSEGDFGDDLSPEEMEIAELATEVVSETLSVTRELIRFVTLLAKSSKAQTTAKDHVDFLEKLVSYWQEIGNEVNELGACVYPPQEIPQMKSFTKKMHNGIHSLRKEVENVGDSKEGLVAALDSLSGCLEKLNSRLCCTEPDDLASNMNDLSM